MSAGSLLEYATGRDDDMKLGFVSAILDDWSFEEALDVAASLGYECMEVACWPQGPAERRYAGVSHIDVEALDDNTVRTIQGLCEKSGVDISALSFYPNVMDADRKKADAARRHLERVLEAANKLAVGCVTTFIGRDQHKTVEENLKRFVEVWGPLIAKAESLSVKIAIENCPMLFGPEQWPGGQNLATTPEIWRRMFELLPSAAFGINYDPSHFVWQMMDYISPLYEFKNRIFHVHFKDIKLYQDKLRQVGSMAYPLAYMSPKLPGLGDVNWGKYVSALTDIGYDGPACVEVEDRAFEGSREKVLESLRLSKKYLSQFVPR